jgi:hypothetical protein
MTVLLLPWAPGLGQGWVKATTLAVTERAPWLQPIDVRLKAPPGPEMALEALAEAGPDPVLIWTGAAALDPAALDPAMLGHLPAAVARPTVRDSLWAEAERQLHLPAQGTAVSFALDLIWAPDASALAALWRDTDAQLDGVLSADLWPHQRLELAFPLTLQRLAPGRTLQDSQKLPESWRQRLPEPWRRMDSNSTETQGAADTLSTLIWTSDNPYAELSAHAREGLAAAALTHAPPPYSAIEAAGLVKNGALMAMAWEQLQAKPSDGWRWGAFLNLWVAAGHHWPWTLPPVDPADLPDALRLQLLQAHQAGWLPQANTSDALLAAVPAIQRALQQLPQAIDTVLDALPGLATADREALRQASLAAPPSLRFPAFNWTSLDAADPVRLRLISQRITDSLGNGEGFSVVRLGDGEGLFLAGQRPCLGGATGNGVQHDPRIGPDGHLPTDVLRALIDQSLQAIERADVVGVPDLSQCLQGPVDYPLVLATLWRALPPPRQEALAPRLLPGGCHLHLYWLANGTYERPPFTGVHGVIAPQLPPPLVGRCRWQPIPGEKGHHPDSEGPAHYPVVFEQTLAWIEREAAPGRLFLVGAGILGKIYCGAIRQRGGVAIDVGSVMDLCSGVTTSRGEFRLNPFLLPRAPRAFRHTGAP